MCILSKPRDSSEQNLRHWTHNSEPQGSTAICLITSMPVFSWTHHSSVLIMNLEWGKLISRYSGRGRMRKNTQMVF